MKLNNLLNVIHYIGKKERIDEQGISLLSSILFIKYMTIFSGLRTKKYTQNKKHSHHNSMISQIIALDRVLTVSLNYNESVSIPHTAWNIP